MLKSFRFILSISILLKFRSLSFFSEIFYHNFCLYLQSAFTEKALYQQVLHNTKSILKHEWTSFAIELALSDRTITY